MVSESILIAIGLICGAVFWETWRARIEPALREWHHRRRLHALTNAVFGISHQHNTRSDQKDQRQHGDQQVESKA